MYSLWPKWYPIRRVLRNLLRSPFLELILLHTFFSSSSLPLVFHSLLFSSSSFSPSSSSSSSFSSSSFSASSSSCTASLAGWCCLPCSFRVLLLIFAIDKLVSPWPRGRPRRHPLNAFAVLQLCPERFELCGPPCMTVGTSITCLWQSPTRRVLINISVVHLLTALTLKITVGCPSCTCPSIHLSRVATEH